MNWIGVQCGLLANGWRYVVDLLEANLALINISLMDKNILTIKCYFH